MTRWLSIACIGFWLFSANGEVAVTASSSQAGSDPMAAFDGECCGTNFVWRGDSAAKSWYWQVDFGEARTIGSILQVQADQDFVFDHGAKAWRWLVSDDGVKWSAVSGASATNDARIVRVIRLDHPIQTRMVRFEISEAVGGFPALREVSFFARTNEDVQFPDWILVVNDTDSPKLPGEGKEFIPLARRSEGKFVPAQQVWLDRFNREFVETEPRPLCVFISGSFKDWCEVRREDFRGMAEVLARGEIPIWASCGGAQALAILAENGVDHEWDCPHCRDPKNPKTPIYTHIGHTDMKKCGDYSGCIFERGPHAVSVVKKDRAFDGLGDSFQVMESHCGQIAYMPRGWEWIVGPGNGTLTKHQAFRRVDRPIYAAQFHIEMSGTPETSNQIMRNFLAIARDWNHRHAAQ